MGAKSCWGARARSSANTWRGHDASFALLGANLSVMAGLGPATHDFYAS